MKPFYLAFLLLLAATLTQAQQTYYVSTTGQDDAGRDGLSLATAWKSIAYAFQQVPAGNNTIQLGAGTFVLSQAASLKDGWTLNGQGHTGSNTTTIINASTFSPEGAICLPLSQERDDFPLENYLIGGNGLENVTISNLVLTSRLDQPLDGAIMMKYARNLELFNLTVREFPWNGIYLREGKQVRIHHSFFEDASYERLCNTWGGALRTRYMNDFTLDHCEFKTTKGGAYGYKGSGHEDAKVHDNLFHGKTTLGADETYRPFDFESAHEFEWGLEIYNNTFNGMVSVPKSNEQGLQSNGGAKLTYPYSIRIHDNTFYGSGGVEGPRSHLEIDHNYFAQKWNNNGRVYEIHGASTDKVGPTSIHHNVAECSMGFIFKKNQNSPDMSIYNNTVYLVNTTRNNFPTSFLEVSGAVSNWQVKNNLVITLDQPNNGTAFSRGSLPTSGFTMSHNLAWNVPGTPAGVEKTDPRLALTGEKPTAYYLAKDQNSAVVDAGTDVGSSFQGSAPDIGAYEWNNTTPPPAPTQHTITATSGGNGSISPSGSVAVNQGQDQSFTITPVAGYQIDDVLVDGGSVGKVATYNFSSVQADHTINATFVIAPPDTEAPSASVISASEPTSFSVVLSWTQATDNVGVTSYEVYQDGTKIATLSPATTIHTVDQLAPGNYTFTLKAVDQAGNQSEQSNPVVITIPAATEPGDSTDTQPPAPFELSAAASPTSLNLSWNTPRDNQAVTSYIILQNGVAVDTLPATATTYTVQNLDADSTYTFTVVAYDAAGNSSQASYTIDFAEIVDPAEPAQPTEPEPNEPPLVQTPTGAPPLFTPNDDGQNDTWQLVLAPNEQLVWLKVYNQQGQVVFTATDVCQPWNGTFHNQPLPTGAYYYILTTTINNVSQTATGSVALIR